MLKYIIGLLISIIAVTFIRSVMGFLMKGAKQAMQEAPPAPVAETSGANAGMLRKCKACGTFALENRMIRQTTKEADLFYCSKECELKAA